MMRCVLVLLCGWALAMAGCGDKRPSNLARLRSADAQERLTGVRALAGTEDAEALTSLLELLAHDRDLEVRTEVVFTLTRCDQARAAQALFDVAAGDDDRWLRMEAVRALGKHRNPSAAGHLVALLQLDPGADRSATSDVQITATLVLGEHRAVALPLLLESIGDPNPAVRAYVAMALGRMRAAESRPQLEKLLEDPDPMVRHEAQFALGQLNNPAADAGP